MKKPFLSDCFIGWKRLFVAIEKTYSLAIVHSISSIGYVMRWTDQIIPLLLVPPKSRAIVNPLPT